MVNLSEVGAHSSSKNGKNTVNLGCYLPEVTSEKGYNLSVKVIHEADQFTAGIEPQIFALGNSGGEYNLWEKKINVSTKKDVPGHFGEPGKYFYRYELTHKDNDDKLWFSDPFARQSGPGTLSAFEVGDKKKFSWEDNDFQVPFVDDMVVYELMVEEFNQNFDGITARLDYLEGLGVNVLELMPVTNVEEPFRWGYMPLSYLAPEERYGGPDAMKRLVNECHKRGIAVILDAVYAHAHRGFAYNIVYHRTGLNNPMMGPFAEDAFDIGTDFEKNFTQEYFQQVNQYWLDEYHVDGFRYDYVPGYYKNPVGPGYANLTYNTYQYSKGIKRFQSDGYSRIIQCAENLPDPKGILTNTYSNSCWQNSLLDKIMDMAEHHYVDDQFPLLLDLRFSGYPQEYHNPANNDSFPVNAFQYMESHDHPRLINEFGLTPLRDAVGGQYGNRRLWYKLQPYVIAIYTCQGIPMIWQGQEFAENYSLPSSGWSRVLAKRALHWEYFYDTAGKSLVHLYRKMGGLRKSCRALRSRNSYYDNQNSKPAQGVVAYLREAPATNGQGAQKAMVLLNFSDTHNKVWLPFPTVGTWREMMHDENQETIAVENVGEWHEVEVPSNYGKILLQE